MLTDFFAVWKEHKWAVIIHNISNLCAFAIIYKMVIPAIKNQNLMHMMLAFIIFFSLSLLSDLILKFASEKWMMGFTFLLSGILLLSFVFGSLMQTFMCIAGTTLFFEGTKACSLDTVFPFSALVRLRSLWQTLISASAHPKHEKEKPNKH
jgi:hypothetical protein